MRLPVLLSDEERRVAYAAAEQWAAEYDLRARCEPYRALAYRGGKPNWPVLQIDDLGGIPFLDDVVFDLFENCRWNCTLDFYKREI